MVRRALEAPDATLHSPRILRDRTRSVVARFDVAGGGGARPLASVIVKAAAHDDTHFFTDWASLAFLATLPAAHDAVPRFLGGDAGERLFVLADLGGSRSLDDVMREPAYGPALRGLAALGDVTARLHAATLGGGGGAASHERAFDALRAALPGPAWPSRADAAARWERDASATLASWREALGVARAPAGLDAALGATAGAYREPREYLALTHGDPAPTNTHVDDADDAGAVRVLDFEYGGFRHALYDPTAWAVLCPLPAPALDALRDAYRATLAAHSPALAAAAAFDAQWAAMVCWRAVAILGWLGASTARENGIWVEEWTRREAAIAACERMAEAVERAGTRDLASLGEFGTTLARTMRERWPEYDGTSALPQWPAFTAEV